MFLLYNLLQALQRRNVESGPTYINFFTDSACHNASFVAQTNNNVANGQCGFAGDGVNSVNVTELFFGCSGMEHFTDHSA